MKKKQACLVIATDVLQEYISNKKDDLGKIMELSPKKNIQIVTSARALIKAIKNSYPLNPDRLKEIVICMDIMCVRFTNKKSEKIG